MDISNLLRTSNFGYFESSPPSCV